MDTFCQSSIYCHPLLLIDDPRSCIGRKFAYVSQFFLSCFFTYHRVYSVVEMQAFLVTLLSKFEFSTPEGANEIRKDRSGVMMPLVVGEENRGSQLPLKVTLLGWN
jgi:hypothetical protein